jgi:hypothetical protein
MKSLAFKVTPRASVNSTRWPDWVALEVLRKKRRSWGELADLSFIDAIMIRWAKARTHAYVLIAPVVFLLFVISFFYFPADTAAVGLGGVVGGVGAGELGADLLLPGGEFGAELPHALRLIFSEVGLLAGILG